MSNTLIAEKQVLRKSIKAAKQRLTSEEKQARARIVFDELVSLPEFTKAETILCYWALPDELPTAEFMNAYVHDKQLLLPVVTGDVLELYEYTGEICLQPQPPFGILEPRGTARIAPEQVDMAIVPGVAFDTQGGRLGRGRGYYDRLFPLLPQAFRVGVCFREQMVAHIPCEAHDVRMHKVLNR